ncbi:MAG: NAD(P)-dependent oxidoreductase, partial [Pseudomonadota bacterium]
MRLFPGFFQMDGAAVVVFGGGESARRKVRLLAKTPAEIRVVADALEPDFAAEFADRVVLIPADGAEAALKGAVFTIIALEDEAEALAAIALAKEAGVTVNAVDRPEHCDFTVPSILDRGDLVAAVATGGAAPVLAKSVRAKLEAALPSRIGDLAALAKSLRPDVKAAIPTEDGRRRYWERVLNGPAADAAYSGDLEQAEALLRSALRDDQPKGVVHIVGAGPGDPDLLTLKALRLMQNADVVFYDRLVSDEIMDLVRRDADRVDQNEEGDEDGDSFGEKFWSHGRALSPPCAP